jgi:5-methylcytosine-specific restriction endonuclease McrA
MNNRLKTGLRPRPNIAIAGAGADAAAQKPSDPPGSSRRSLMQAPVLVLKGVAQAEETNHGEVHSTSRSVAVPSVIRLLSYRHIPQQSRALSRKNILLRDRNTCQFCGKLFPASELTLDHVMPRSRGGRSTWENLVACCYTCNNSKGDRTPEEAGFQLQRRPRPFTLHTSRQLMRLMGHRDEKWRKYLFY